MKLTQIDSAAAHSLGLASFLTSLLGVFGLLPIIITCVAGVFAAGAYAITMWESVTVQRWVTRRAALRKARKVEKLRRQQMVLAAKLQGYDILDEATAIVRQQVADAHQGVLSPIPLKSSQPQLSVSVSGASGPRGNH